MLFMLMKKTFLTGMIAAGLVCLCGCAFHHHKTNPNPPMKTYVERPPENTVQPRFDAVSPTTGY
jgi:hypothetical protein